MESNVANTQTQTSQNNPEAEILAHAEKHFSLNKSEVDLLKTNNPNLPSGVQSYYLEKKGSYGNKYYNYLVMGNKLYCSGTEGDFERFLKDAGFLEKKNFNENNFWNVFQLLKFNDRENILIDKEVVEKPYEFLKPFASTISAPKLEYGDAGAIFTFFTANSGDMIVKKYRVTVDRDYQVKTDVQTLEKPV